MYEVFGESPVMVLLVLVVAEVEYCAQLLPPFVLYSHTSQVVEADAETVTAFGVMLLVLILTEGAARSILSSETVVVASIQPIYVPLYVPLKRHEAPR